METGRWSRRPRHPPRNDVHGTTLAHVRGLVAGEGSFEPDLYASSPAAATPPTGYPTWWLTRCARCASAAGTLPLAKRDASSPTLTPTTRLPARWSTRSSRLAADPSDWRGRALPSCSSRGFDHVTLPGLAASQIAGYAAIVPWARPTARRWAPRASAASTRIRISAVCGCAVEGHGRRSLDSPEPVPTELQHGPNADWRAQWSRRDRAPSPDRGWAEARAERGRPGVGCAGLRSFRPAMRRHATAIRSVTSSADPWSDQVRRSTSTSQWCSLGDGVERRLSATAKPCAAS